MVLLQFQSVVYFQTIKKFTPKPEDTYAWQPTSVTSFGPESQPTSAFSYTPASPSHHHANQVSMHDPRTSSPAQSNTSTFTSSSSLPPLVDSSTSSQRQRTVSQSSSSSQPPVQNGVDHHVSKSMLHLKDEPSRLPPSQSPFITLLQKNRGESSLVTSTWEQMLCQIVFFNIYNERGHLTSFSHLHDTKVCLNSRLALNIFTYTQKLNKQTCNFHILGIFCLRAVLTVSWLGCEVTLNSTVSVCSIGFLSMLFYK